MCILMLALAGCGLQPLYGTPERIQASASAAPREVTIPPSATPSTPRVGPTEEPRRLLTDLQSIPPGNYLAYSVQVHGPEEGTPPPIEVRLLGTNGEDLGLIAGLQGDDWAISPDGRWLAYSCLRQGGDLCPKAGLGLLSLESNVAAQVTGIDWGIGSWSPDGAHLVIADYGEIAIVDVSTRERIPISACQKWSSYEPADCSEPQWSPDGRYISFQVGFSHSGPRDERSGLYLMETTCLPNHSSCWAGIVGPLPVGPGYTWSPDGRFLGYQSSVDAPGEGILLYEVALRTVSTVIPYPMANSQEIWGNTAFSFDGRFLATSWGDILDAASGTILATFPGEGHGRIQWLALPPPIPSVTPPTAQ
jgi:hypothetical protein